MRIGSRIVTLVALAAIASVAFALPSVAAAEETSLCSADGSGCGITHIHETTLSGAKAKLLTSIINVECDVLFLGETFESSGAPLLIEGNLTYSNCSGSCTVEETGGGVVIEVLKLGHETADVTGEGEVHVSCSGLNCYYNGEELLGTAKGPLLSSETNGEVKIAGQTVKKVKGLFCPSTSTLDITTTPLSATYIGPFELAPATSTSLATSLKGGGKEGAKITVAEGSKVKDTATLSGEHASEAGGTVKYKVYKDKACKELVTSAGEVSVSGGSVPNSEERELEAGAVYYWQAEYGGDSMNKASTSACGDEVLTVKAKVTLSTSLKGGGKEGEEITVSEGSKVKDQATLSGTKSSSATGTIKYKVYKDKECKELATNAGEGEVKEGKAPASEEKELEAGKEYFWQAEYGGDSLHEAATSTCSKEVLKVKANTSLSTSLSGGGKEGAEITVIEGSKVKDTATLSGTNASGATGTVDYAVYKDKECKELASEAGKGKVEGTKAASSEEKELEAGAVYYWQAKYLGDSLHGESTSTCSKEVETIKAKVTLSTKLSGGGKEGEEITVAEGSKVKDQTTLSGTKSSTATGTVKYKVYKDKECTELATNAGEVSVSGGSVPNSEEKELEAGKEYFWQAEYGGDSLHEAATSTCSKEVLKVKANTSLSTSLSGGGKEGAEITVAEGSEVKDTATLSGTNASGATGTVDYAVYKDSECKELATEAGKVTVTEGKAPASEEKELEVGTYYWQAKYLGDSLHGESTSTCGDEILTVIEEEEFESHKTDLCTADDAGSICLEAHKLSTIDFKDSAVDFLTNLISSKCEGLISSTSVGEAGEPQKVNVKSEFSSCTNGCVVTEIGGGSKLGFLYETSKKSTKELASVTTEGLELFYKCGETVKCAYGPIKAVGDALGALKTEDNGHITFNKDSLGTGEGLLCPSEASVDALFVASSPLYIREVPVTSLCSKDEGSPVCKSENQLKTIDYKDNAVEILTNLINVKCEGLASGTVGKPGNSLEIEVTEGGFNCGGGCFVTNVSGPGKIMLERLKSEEAKATAEGFEIFVKCGETIKCLLGPEKMVGTALGPLTTGDNGHLTFSKVSMGKGEGATCPTEAKLDATLIASSAAYIG